MTKRNFETPAPSATVVLLRDGPDDLEVLLLRRHSQSFVLGGAYVFPGGKVDPEDAASASRLDRELSVLHAQLGEPELPAAEAGALYVAAIRELFEEAGLLLADVSPEQAVGAWTALRAGERFDALIAALDLRLAAGALQPWSRWITPTLSSVGRRRFDTRFFLAAVPPGQVARHDEHEATESLWIAPRAALREYWANRIDLAPPQIMSLTHLARHRDVASAFAAARSRKPPCIRPEPHEIEGTRVLCYPGDPGHPQSEQLLPGPTRLCWRNERFEPEAGLGILLGE
ncbi:NUDIX domain-containing protein [Ramlibacter monticola]|uniref:NUDIX domain-containing protein n=2 Tax=Ramlibacter monticola TaxID=1926872 RepID=A0A936Z9P2_9BURK|nr:NUDIX domain-containing protein [Ramlibacter monticola]